MQTIDEFSKELQLTEEQTNKLQNYISEMVVELLLSIKEDNNKNFDETIKNLSSK
ncbi:MAG TPA: hypothetical protein PK370_01955 [Candidatus Woesebacteria bacterium]|nr:hypothetical protein [Candidatus Woesebacteria bacterium]HPJ16891.1 hypothetical protein [Candidatus Woesebacteria bacterium]